MSRARWFVDKNGETIWFDQKQRAKPEHLELLSDYEGTELDDLLDEALTQKQVLQRLRLTTDSHLIPADILEKRRQKRLEQKMAPACRICSINGWECEGRITRHHFVPRWLLRELENYVSYASRSLCTIPICISRHRDLHYKGDGTDKSIVPYLRDHERKFAHKLLDELKEEHPKIYELLASGEGEYAYEAQLVEDHLIGNFARAENAYNMPEYVDIDRRDVV